MDTDNTKPDPQKQHKRKRILVPIMAITIVILLISTVFLALLYDKERQVIGHHIPIRSKGDIRVDLGSLKHRQEGDRMVQRSDKLVEEVRSFLKNEELSSCDFNDTVHQVVAHSNDETQLLIKHSCGSSGAWAFAAKKDSKWQIISQSSQFNKFGAPSCQMVDANNIATEIAPICQNETRTAKNGAATYTYKIR